MNDSTGDKTSAMPGWELLAWDTAFFGFAVARVLEPPQRPDQIGALLDNAAGAGVRLLYWLSESEIPKNVAQSWGVFLADMRTHFACELGAVEKKSTCPPSVRPFHGGIPVSAMEDLAIESGQLSRFRVDPRIPVEKFEGLYRNWMQESLRGNMADETLVSFSPQGDLTGMVTLREDSERNQGAIGLIAVKPGFRNQGYGEELVNGAKWWSRQRGHRLATVITQGRNQAARKLYEKCGYVNVKTEFFYHIWNENAG